MRIIQLIPGTCEAFYCENCLRDFDLIDAVKALGHEAHVVPLYLPLTADRTEDRGDAPIFFGGVKVYLQEKSALFRRAPGWVGRMLDSRRLLQWASKRTAMTSPEDLGESTLSMLRGEHGHQARELGRLAAWLAERERPEVVCLSSALLVGLARRLRETLGVPVVCMLQDEDGFLDALAAPYGPEAWEAVRAGARHVDGFIAVSRFYRDLMTERLNLDPERVAVVHPGLQMDGYVPAAEPANPPTIGFLSPSVPGKGLDTLVEILARLRQEEGLRDTRLAATGGQTTGSHPFLEDLQARIQALGLAAAVDLQPYLGRRARQRFLRAASVLSVPLARGEAYGMYILEALASGVPVVEPRLGGVAELVEETGGGVLVDPNDPDALAAALADLLRNPERARELGERGREAVLERFAAERSAEALVATFQRFAT